MSLHTRASDLLPHASMPQRAKLAVALVPAARFCIMKSYSGESRFKIIKTTAITDITVKLIDNVL